MSAGTAASSHYSVVPQTLRSATLQLFNDKKALFAVKVSFAAVWLSPRLRSLERGVNVNTA